MRLLAIGRTAVRYGERLAGHRAALTDQVVRRAGIFQAMAAAPGVRDAGWQFGHEPGSPTISTMSRTSISAGCARTRRPRSSRPPRRRSDRDGSGGARRPAGPRCRGGLAGASRAGLATAHCPRLAARQAAAPRRRRAPRRGAGGGRPAARAEAAWREDGGGLDGWITQDQLSLGEARRLNLARAWLSDKALILLDEPTEHLDEDQGPRILARLLVRLDDRIVVPSSHRPVDGTTAGPGPIQRIDLSEAACGELTGNRACRRQRSERCGLSRPRRRRPRGSSGTRGWRAPAPPAPRRRAARR